LYPLVSPWFKTEIYKLNHFANKNDTDSSNNEKECECEGEGECECDEGECDEDDDDDEEEEDEDEDEYEEEVDNKQRRRFTIIRPDFIELIHRLNSQNSTIQNQAILSDDEANASKEDRNITQLQPMFRIRFPLGLGLELNMNREDIDGEGDEAEEKRGGFEYDPETNRRRFVERKKSQSKNFEVIKNNHFNFSFVGGYQNIKEELMQCVDMLKNHEKYIPYNVRIPKGLILEGPPGTGKTLLAKALAGESRCSFIPASGDEFSQKYVGDGAARIKELFKLARENVPCIIFIDEIDALGRKRSGDGEASSAERDTTLNALLVELDGFVNSTGIFLVAATNRVDLLDRALMRPGRIDKNIFIGLPDKETREAIIRIHIRGKPYDKDIRIEDLIETTETFSGAQIENLLNEAMLHALKKNKVTFNGEDIEVVMNKIISGWQPFKHEFTKDMVRRIAIHEIGHALVGLYSKSHSKLSKVIINLSSPKSPGYTLFKSLTSDILTRSALFEHLMILLSGRVAEEVFYNITVTTGARADFEEALKMAYDMVTQYGMGTSLIYPRHSEKYKEMIDDDVKRLIEKAYYFSKIIIRENKELVKELAEILERDRILKVEDMEKIIRLKYDMKGLNTVAELDM